jgi:hypothetical protein
MIRFTSFTRIFVFAAYLVGSVGFPVFDIGQINSSGAYPCEGHACGCTSAEQCWQKCCCTTATERLAWAKRNHVTPPVVLVQLLEAHPAESEQCDADHACCSHSQSATEPNRPSAKANRKWHFISSFQAMKCRGHHSYWSVAAEPALATTAALLWHVQSPEIGTVASSTVILESWGSSPPTPPG